MIFTEIEIAELKEYQQKNNYRYFFTQSYLYAKLAKKNNIKYKILAVKKDNNIVAYSIFLFFKHKKLFYKAVTHYGPIIENLDEKIYTFYFEQLKKYFAKNIFITTVIINPFVNDSTFSDINLIEENEKAKNIDNCIKKLNFSNLNEDAFTNPLLAGRCVYSKNITNLEKTLFLKSISTRAKRSIENAKKEFVKVRELDIFNDKDAKIFDDINRSTEKRINFKIRENKYFQNFKLAFGDNIKFLCSYIDTTEYLAKNEEKLINLKSELENLKNSVTKTNVNYEKLNLKIEKQKELIAKTENKIFDMQKLKADFGEELYLSCASFIASGQDLIYYTGAFIPDFSKYFGVYAIHDFMINYSLENNFSYYNFFGTSNDFTENAVDYSVLQFKRNFKGNIERFMDNYVLTNKLGKFLN